MKDMAFRKMQLDDLHHLVLVEEAIHLDIEPKIENVV